jgi:hypothetical protein
MSASTALWFSSRKRRRYRSAFGQAIEYAP